MSKKIAEIYYCKSLKKTGKPIVVKFDTMEYNVKQIRFNDVDIKMKFNNARGKAKRSGATTVLEVYKHD